MSKPSTPPPSKPMQKMFGRGRKAEHHTAADFRHCRPKRDWPSEGAASSSTRS